MAPPNTVLLQARGQPLVVERQSNEASTKITPGMLLEVDSNGKYVRHNTAVAATGRVFAGDPINFASSIDTDYENGEDVPGIYLRGGDMVYSWLKAGEGARAIGDLLYSNGDGTLSNTSTNAVPGALVGMVEEATATNSAKRRVKVRVA